jgi:hypothetical protein
MTGNIRTLNLRNKAAMVATAKYVAPQIQGHMRANASWTDRTGNARNGLFATVQTGADEVRIVLGHSVPYGFWLEVRWSGKYAIIIPTLQVWGPKFFALLAKSMFDAKGPAA